MTETHGGREADGPARSGGGPDSAAPAVGEDPSLLDDVSTGGDPGLPDISDIEGATTGPLEVRADEPAGDPVGEVTPGPEPLSPEELAALPPPAFDADGDRGSGGGSTDPTAPLDLADSGEPTAVMARPDGPPPPGSGDAGGRESDPGASESTTAPPTPLASTEPAPTGQLATPVVDPPPTRSRRPARLVLALLGAVVVAGTAVWLVDAARHSDRALRGTVLGATDVGGLDRAGIEAVVADLDDQLATTPLTVAVGDDTIDTNPAAMGVSLDGDRLVDDALAARQPFNPIEWLTSFFDDEVVELAYTTDTSRTMMAAESVVGAVLPQPTEPDIDLQGGTLVATPGESGVRVSPDEIADELPEVLAGPAPYRLDLEPITATPAIDDDTVEALVDDANDATAQAVVFRVLDEEEEVAPETVRNWVRLSTADGPAWEIDRTAALDDLKPLFPSLGSEDQQARFAIVDGEPIIIPASETVICCAVESLDSVRDGLVASPSSPENGDAPSAGDGDDQQAPLRVITLEPAIVGADEGVAELESLGIIEEVSSFTTEHPCCAPRVVNIQRFADLMQGVVIRPGEDLSLNGQVGQRTIDKGFVADSAIVNGVLEPQVGGGVSQFATTFFNAAFFAGIDFNEYQSHSLYISRYPRGREATISWRRPDLSVKNTTPYGILVWSTYTPTSITVTFYSTRNIEVEAREPVRSSRGECSIYTTPRIRTYPDGSVVEDSVFALYRPDEGLDCNGNSTRPDNDSSAPTAAPPPPDEPTPTAPVPTEPADDAAPRVAPDDGG